MHALNQQMVLKCMNYPIFWYDPNIEDDPKSENKLKNEDNQRFFLPCRFKMLLYLHMTAIS